MKAVSSAEWTADLRVVHLESWSAHRMSDGYYSADLALEMSMEEQLASDSVEEWAMTEGYT